MVVVAVVDVVVAVVVLVVVVDVTVVVVVVDANVVVVAAAVVTQLPHITGQPSRKFCPVKPSSLHVKAEKITLWHPSGSGFPLHVAFVVTTVAVDVAVVVVVVVVAVVSVVVFVVVVDVAVVVVVEVSGVGVQRLHMAGQSANTASAHTAAVD